MLLTATDIDKQAPTIQLIRRYNYYHSPYIFANNVKQLPCKQNAAPKLRRLLTPRAVHVPRGQSPARKLTRRLRTGETRKKGATLPTALDKVDVATTIPFMEFSPELRDQIYDYILTDMTTTELLTKTVLREHMCCVSTQSWVEAVGMVNKGDYDTIPKLNDIPVKSSTPVPATQSVAPDSMAPNSIGSDIRSFRFSLIGPAG